MNSINHETVVGLFAGPKTGMDRALRKWEPTIQSLILNSARPVLINQGTQYDDDGWFDTGLPLMTGFGQTEIVKPDVIRDFTGRFPGHKLLRSLNEKEVLDIVKYKAVTYALFDEASRGAFVLLDTIEQRDVGNALHSIPGEKVVLKPDAGLSGKDVVVLEKHQAEVEIDQYRERGYIIQQFMPGSLGTEITSNLRGINKIQQASINTNAEHELRLFMAGLNDQNIVPILRQTEDAKSKYVYIDPETVPTSVFDFGRMVMKTIQKASGIGEIFLAVDCIYNEQTSSLVLREANGKEPGMPSIENDKAISSWIHSNHAHQILRVAELGPKIPPIKLTETART